MILSRDPLDVCRVIGLGVFCFSLSYLLSDSQPGTSTDRLAPASGASGAASRIYIDPTTGERGAPPPGAPEVPGFKAPAVPMAALSAERRENGAVRVRLHGNFRSYSVATVSPSGELTQDCFDDVEAAAAAVRSGGARRAGTGEPQP